MFRKIFISALLVMVLGQFTLSAAPKGLIQTQLKAEKGDVKAQLWLGKSWYNRANDLYKFLERKKQGKLTAETRKEMNIKAKNLIVAGKNAFKWSSMAAKQNNPEGMYVLGLCYFHGFGVSKDSKMTVSLFQKADQLGHIPATRDLAYCYLKGEGVEENLTEAINLYRKAAAKGDKQSKLRLKNLGVEEK
ncbi:MAG: sel1 repeat family protein [Lentisphaeria bacterium]|nr:sel1 repeat family protein [Lentisphaeria bacterium]